MELFKLIPKIHKFNTFQSFASEFLINKSDLIIASESSYYKFIEPLTLQCNVIFPKKYGNGEPTDYIINKVIEASKAYDFKRVIAVGGGAILDIGKLLVLKDLKDAKSIFEKKMDFIKEKELVMLPTTCGTGSEVTNFSVAEFPELKSKMGVGINELFADDAVLIPELLMDLPYNYFAFSAIDALVHAMESYVSPKANYYSEIFALEGIKLIINGFKKLRENGKTLNPQLIEDFLIGSNFAGIAFGNTGVGAVHALSYPLGGNYHLPHGECNYQFLIEVFKKYSEINPEGKIKNLNTSIAKLLSVLENNVYDDLAKLLNCIWEKKTLSSYGMKKDEIELFSLNVFEQQQRLLSNNYVPFSLDNIKAIYSILF